MKGWALKLLGPALLAALIWTTDLGELVDTLVVNSILFYVGFGWPLMQGLKVNGEKSAISGNNKVTAGCIQQAVVNKRLTLTGK